MISAGYRIVLDPLVMRRPQGAPVAPPFRMGVLLFHSIEKGVSYLTGGSGGAYPANKHGSIHQKSENPEITILEIRNLRNHNFGLFAKWNFSKTFYLVSFNPWLGPTALDSTDTIHLEEV